MWSSDWCKHYKFSNIPSKLDQAVLCQICSWEAAWFGSWTGLLWQVFHGFPVSPRKCHDRPLKWDVITSSSSPPTLPRHILTHLLTGNNHCSWYFVKQTMIHPVIQWQIYCDNKEKIKLLIILLWYAAWWKHVTHWQVSMLTETCCHHRPNMDATCSCQHDHPHILQHSHDPENNMNHQWCKNLKKLQFMNFCSLLYQLHEKMVQQMHVVTFSEQDITYLHTHIHTLSKQRDGINKYMTLTITSKIIH